MNISRLHIGFFLMFAAATSCWADTTDMWDSYARNAGLFTPHVDNCDSGTEVFIAIGGTTFGYCIEKDQRAPVVYSEARNICASVGKRLPSYNEYKFACDNPPSGLVNMTTDREWVAISDPSVLFGTSLHLIFGMTVGDFSSCALMWPQRIGTTAGVEDPFWFRCVR